MKPTPIRISVIILILLYLFGAIYTTFYKSKKSAIKAEEKIIISTKETELEKKSERKTKIQVPSAEMMTLDDLQEEARQFGIYISNGEEKQYRSNRHHLFTNKKLADAIKKSSKENDTLFLCGDKCTLYQNHLWINLDENKEAIIVFIEKNTPIAKTYLPFSELREEAKKFSIYLWSSDEDNYREFRKRLLTNENLSSMLKKAEKENVSIYIEKKFRVNTGMIHINMNDNDEEIIKALKEEAEEFGVLLMLYYEDEYRQIRPRILSSKKMADAFKRVKKQGYYITTENKFSWGINGVKIDVGASDEKIIEFLNKH